MIDILLDGARTGLKILQFYFDIFQPERPGKKRLQVLEK